MSGNFTIRSSLQKTGILLLLFTIIFSPRPLLGYWHLGQAQKLEKAGNLTGAASEYSEAAQRLPWRPDLWEKAGEAAFLTGDSQRARTDLDLAVEKGALNAHGWLILGQVYQTLGDLQSAVSAWEHALPLADAYRFLAELKRNSGDFTGAQEEWLAYLAQIPNDSSAHYALGLLLAATSPNDALPELMRASGGTSVSEDAIQILRTALNRALLTNDPAFQFLLSGRALAAVGEWDLAAEAFRRSIEAKPDHADAWAWLGEAKQHLSQNPLPDLQQGLALDPSSVIVQALWGLYYQRQGLPEQAISAYEKAAESEPGNPAWQVSLGRAYTQAGSLVEAYRHFLQAVETAPGDVSAWQALADFCLTYQVDVGTTGLAAVDQLAELAPDDWLTWDLVGQVMFSLGKYDQARDYLEKAVHLDASQPAASFHLALVYIQQGDAGLAYPLLMEVQKNDPGGAYAAQAARIIGQLFP